MAGVKKCNRILFVARMLLCHAQMHGVVSDNGKYSPRGDLWVLQVLKTSQVGKYKTVRVANNLLLSQMCGWEERRAKRHEQSFLIPTDILSKIKKDLILTYDFNLSDRQPLMISVGEFSSRILFMLLETIIHA